MSSEKDFINPFIPNKEIAKNYTPLRLYSFKDIKQFDDKWNDFHEYNKEYYRNVSTKDWSGLTSENHLLNALLSGPSPVPNSTIYTDPETEITYIMMDMPLYDDLVTSVALNLSTLSTNQDILDHQQLEQEFWNDNT